MIESGDLRGAVDAFFSIVCPGLWSRLSDSEKEPYLSSGPMLVADLTQPPFEVSIDELHSVVLPLHAIAGADSAPFLHDTSVVIANAVPGATFEEFANCGHVTYVEQEAKFADATKAVARRSFED
jgi:pimeloyl-ACP methyl ester carboxylesterase